MKVIANLALFDAAKTKTYLVRYAHRPDGQKGWFVPHAEVPRTGHPAVAAAGLLATAPAIALAAADSFVGNDGTWHLPLTYRATVSDLVPRFTDQAAIAEGRWFPLDALPPRREVAHGGWGLDLVAQAL